VWFWFGMSFVLLCFFLSAKSFWCKEFGIGKQLFSYGEAQLSWDGNFGVISCNYADTRSAQVEWILFGYSYRELGGYCDNLRYLHLLFDWCFEVKKTPAWIFPTFSRGCSLR